MPTFTFDPRDFISAPYVTCPYCGKKAFGILSIFRNGYSRRCNECLCPKGLDPSATYPLPELNKRIIYIDQLAISEMMKALNPETRAHQKAKVHPFWLRLFEKLDSLCKLQLIVCPESTSHTDESLVSPWYDQLKRMYQLLSYGACFRTPDEIRSRQLVKHARNWIKGEAGKPLNLDSRSAIPQQINAWQEKWIITADRDYDQSWIDQLRDARARNDELLNSLFTEWKSEKDASFDTWYRREALGYGKGYLQSYALWMDRLMNAEQAATAIAGAFLPPPAVGTITVIQDSFRDAGVAESDVVTSTIQYFTSDTLLDVPFIKIAAMMTAAMARQAKAGRKKPPGRGFRNDVRIVSTLLPYCDAMFLDNECRHLLEQKPLCDGIDYGTKVFSPAVRDKFLKYLDDIKATTPSEHFHKVREVYGPDWPEPFTALYT